MSSLSLSLSLTPFILRVSPGSCWGWTPANDGHPTEWVQVVLEPAGHKEAAHTSIQAPPPTPCGASSPCWHLSWRHTSPSGPNAGWAQHRCRGMAISAQHKASLLGSLCFRTVVLAEMLTSLHFPLSHARHSTPLCSYLVSAHAYRKAWDDSWSISLQTMY